MLKFNDKELISASFNSAVMEGRINYRIVQNNKPKSNFKEYWIKLWANLLFFFNINSQSVINKQEPVGVLVLENMTADLDEDGESLFAFIMTFSCEPGRKHVFSCKSLLNARQWVTALRNSSYEHLQMQKRLLQNRLEQLTGKVELVQRPMSNIITRKAPELPTQGKVVGPKQNTFISHVSTFNSIWNPINKQDASKQESEDLIKF